MSNNINDGIFFWDWFYAVPVLGQQEACAAVGIEWCPDEIKVRDHFDNLVFVDSDREELVDENAQEQFIAICNDWLREAAI